MSRLERNLNVVLSIALVAVAVWLAVLLISHGSSADLAPDGGGGGAAPAAAPTSADDDRFDPPWQIQDSGRPPKPSAERTDRTRAGAAEAQPPAATRRRAPRPEPAVAPPASDVVIRPAPPPPPPPPPTFDDSG